MTDTDADRLIAFITARLDDDVAGVDRVVNAEIDELRLASAASATREEILEFRADLRRSLADVEAKRRIVEQCARIIATKPALEPEADNAWDVLFALASAHSAEPGYDPAWTRA